MATEQMQELQNLLIELDKAVAEYEERGQIKAAAENRYRVVLSQELLKGRAKGLPVTILRDISQGTDKVANARLRRDVAEAMHETTRERIHAIKIKARIIDNQLSRDLELAGKK